MTPQPQALPITAEPWGEVRDLEELHAGATGAILQAVTILKAGAGTPGGRRPMPLVVLGTAGIGKTHLFSRLRRRLGKGAILVHIRPIMSAEMTPRYVLGEIFRQLGQTSGGARQIDNLVGATLARGWDGTAEQADDGLELLRALGTQGRRENLDLLGSRLLERMPDLDDGYLEPLLNAPFMDTRTLNAALAWLGGRDISEAQAGRIGVQLPLAEDRVLPALRTVARLAAPCAPLVVVFDQLENLVQAEGHGRIQAYGNLIMELVDEVRDLVIVQMSLDSEWTHGIRPVLSLTQRARVEGSTHTLEMPSPNQAEQLVRLWMTDFPAPAAPFPWPFQGAEITGLAERGATPRMLLQALQQRLDGVPLADDEVQDAGDALLAQAWEDGLRRARAEIDAQDAAGQNVVPEVLADGLIQLAGQVPGFRLLEARGPGDLRLATPRGEVRVALIHQPRPRAIASALGHLAAVPGRKLGLREFWRPFKPTWTVSRNNLAILQEAGGWHWLERGDAAQLLALDGLLKAAASGDLSGPGGLPFATAQVRDWVQRALALPAWGITQALAQGGRGAEEETASGPAPAIAEDGPGRTRPTAAGRGPATPGPRPDALPACFALQRLHQLRVASVDRLLQEGRRADPALTRKGLLAELASAPAGLLWIGDHIVCLGE